MDAEFDDGTVVKTDQKPGSGGDGSAPEPFQLFLASLGACAGIYVLRFCQSRGIATDGLRIVQKHERKQDGRVLHAISIDIEVPPEFPKKYHAALVRAAAKCPVKRVIFDPPEIKIQTVVTEVRTAQEDAG